MHNTQQEALDSYVETVEQDFDGVTNIDTEEVDDTIVATFEITLTGVSVNFFSVKNKLMTHVQDKGGIVIDSDMGFSRGTLTAEIPRTVFNTSTDETEPTLPERKTA